MNRRGLVVSLGAAALAACSRQEETPAAAPSDESSGRAVTDPAAVVRQLYAPYLAPDAVFPGLREQAPWSAAMLASIDAMTARSQVAGDPILDFDPVIGAQDYQLSDLNIANEAIAEGSHAVVRASFTNIGQPTEIVYDLVWEDYRWKVDNVRGDGWDLRQIAQQA